MSSPIMTVYIPKLRELPIQKMRQLDPTAQCSLTESDGAVTAFAYDWPDLRVVVHVTPRAELERHLEGFVGFIRHSCERRKKPFDYSLEQRILSTTFVLGFVPEREDQPDCCVDRVWHMLLTIASNTGSLIFWEGSVYDGNAKRLFP